MSPCVRRERGEACTTATRIFSQFNYLSSLQLCVRAEMSQSDQCASVQRARMLLLLVLVCSCWWSQCHCTTFPNTPSSSRPAASSHLVTLALGVSVAESHGRSEVSSCVQLFGGVVHDNQEHHSEDDDNKPTHIKIVQVYPLQLSCSSFTFKDMSTPLTILFPGGDHRNCSQSPNHCSVVLALPSEPAPSHPDVGSNEGDYSHCYDLYVGVMTMPSKTRLKMYRQLRVRHIHGVTQTCNPETFAKLLNGSLHIGQINERADSDSLLSELASAEIAVFSDETLSPTPAEPDWAIPPTTQPTVGHLSTGTEETPRTQLDRQDSLDAEEAAANICSCFWDWDLFHFLAACAGIALGLLSFSLKVLYRRWELFWRNYLADNEFNVVV